MEIQVTAEQTRRVIGGKVYPVTITRRIGPDSYTGAKGEVFQAGRAVFMDFGPKRGVQKTYLLHQEREPEERQAWIARVKEAAARAATEQNLW